MGGEGGRYKKKPKWTGFVQYSSEMLSETLYMHLKRVEWVVDTYKTSRKLTQANF